MNIDANDPKWTAYALGEITDEQERAEIESILKESAEMRRLVEEIRQMAGFLKEELQAEPAIQLTEAQREQIEEKATAGRNWFGLRPAWAMACAAAAILLMSLVVVKQLRETGSRLPAPVASTASMQKPVQNPEKQNSLAAADVFSPKDIKKSEKSDAMASLPAGKHGVVGPGIGVRIAGGFSGGAAGGGAPGNVNQERMETSASTGTVLGPDYLTNMPTTTNDVMSLVNSIGGVVPPSDNPLFDANQQMLAGTAAPGIAVIRDGINVNEVHWDSGINTPSRIDPKSVSEFKVVLSPTDAEYGRGAGQVQIAKKENNKGKERADQSSRQSNSAAAGATASSGPGTGGGIGAGQGTGIGPGMGGGMGYGGVAGGVTGGLIAQSTMSPPPPPPPQATKRLSGNYMIDSDGVGAAQMWPKMPPPPPRPPYYQGPWPPIRYHLGWFNTEAYDHIRDNAFLDITQNPLSTFSIDVDTASYSNMRRFLDQGQFPPIDAIRIEELVNYFDYEYKAPKDGKPFAANFEITEAPWNPSHRLLRIALKGREINQAKRSNSNLVFLLDVSGSMGEPNKLSLVKQSMEMLVDKLTESDRVAIVTYSTDASLYLPPTRGDQKAKLKDAIEQLYAGGSTNGAGGIQLAYQTAQENFIRGGINRVILATDGDFNVGITDRGSLTRLIEQKAESGIFLSALGYGMGNLKDSTLELLADKGRGNYAYIDNLQEAKKVLVDQMDATLVAIAKDVKIQVEFNPVHVSSYRLIGYEDRVMAKEDFNNDAKKAGVIGAGHEVTALYEIVPSGVSPTPGVDPLKYQKQAQPSPAAHSDEVVTVKVRSKDPEKDTSVLSEFAIKESERKFNQASPDFKFAAAVAAFGMILRNSQYKGSADFLSVLNWATAGKGEDVRGYRAEFIRLVHRAMSISF
jgi:Ca-activated chloride channel homolog